MKRAMTRRRVPSKGKGFVNRSVRRRVRGRKPINDDTGLRKLMRYARRGLLPEERLGLIMRAQQSAARRLGT